MKTINTITNKIIKYQITSVLIFPHASPLTLKAVARNEPVSVFESFFAGDIAESVFVGVGVADAVGATGVSVIFPVFESKQTVTCLQTVVAPSTFPVSADVDVGFVADGVGVEVGVGVGVGVGVAEPETTFTLQLDCADRPAKSTALTVAVLFPVVEKVVTRDWPDPDTAPVQLYVYGATPPLAADAKVTVSPVFGEAGLVAQAVLMNCV